MFRAFFLALGFFICVVGLECLVIEKVFFNSVAKAPPPDPFSFGQEVRSNLREVIPPDWAPWGLLAAGVIVILYSFTIPRRLHG